MQITIYVVSAAGVLVCLLSALHLCRSRHTLLLALPMLSLLVGAVANQTSIGSNRLVIATTGMVLLSTAWVIASNWKRVTHTRLPGRAFLCLAIPVEMLLVEAIVSPETPLWQTAFRAAPLLMITVLVPVLLLEQMKMQTALNTLILTFGISCSSVLFAPSPWVSCSKFKCGGFGELFAGPFESENFFGGMACIALLCGLALPPRQSLLKVVVLPTATLVLYASESRSSQVALAVALVAWAATLMRLSKVRRKLVGWTPIVGMILAASTVLVYKATPTSFSHRGGIWRLGRNVIGDQWVFGRGLSTWSTDVLERNYMHSQTLLLLYSGGAVALVIYGAFVSLAVNSVGLSRVGFGCSITLFVLVRGITEVAWNPLALDGTMFLFLPVLFIALVEPRQRRPRKLEEILRTKSGISVGSPR